MPETAKIIPIRPKSYTTPEKFIEEIRKQIFSSQIPYKELAVKCGVGPSTIQNLASGKTRWPRPTTLFPLLHALNVKLQIVG